MRTVLHAARATLVAVAVLGLALTSWAAETTKAKTFASLSPGEQKIARALFEAQTTTGSAKPLTLDEIAAKRTKTGWGEAFKSMKSQGLVTQKNLGEVVSSYERKHPEVASKPVKAEKAKAEPGR
jgi:hypothetical protein